MVSDERTLPAPCVVENRVYYVSNRGELVCLETEGFRDDRNDSPITDERFHEQTDADFVWILDMVKELGVVPRHASASPSRVVDDLIYMVTGNEPKTGKLIRKFECNTGDNGSPAPGPDEKNNLMATPVYRDDKVFIAVGQDPEIGAGPGCLWAIDASKTGDVTATAAVWSYRGGDFGRSLSTVAVCDDLLYAAELQGYLHCVEAATGRRLWRYDRKASVWSSPLAADGKVYVANEDGDVFVFQQGRTGKLLAQNAMKDTADGMVTPANNVLYVGDRTHLFAISAVDNRPATESTPQGAEGAAANRPCASVSSAPASQPASAWPMFRGNSQLTGIATRPRPDDPRVQWGFLAGDAMKSSAAIMNGVVYVCCACCSNLRNLCGFGQPQARISQETHAP